MFIINPFAFGGDNLFAVTPYTGNGSTQSIVTGQNLGGLAWLKESGASGNHGLWDSTRGATNLLVSNTTAAETSVSGVSAFASNGFTLGSNATYNNSSDTFVAFSWLEQAGYMDVVTYSGTSIARNLSHNLAAVPKFVIVKARNSSASLYAWIVGHDSLGWDKTLRLYDTSAAASDAFAWDNTTPTSSVISLGASAGTNTSGISYVMYLFAEKAGKSKFGMVNGNGSARTISGFGFRPKLMIYKDVTTSTFGWYMLYEQGGVLYQLNANGNDARSTATAWTFTNDGFTLTGAAQNESGRDYIYAAWG